MLTRLISIYFERGFLCLTSRFEGNHHVYVLFREGFWMWLVGLCASVGGVVATSNIAAIIIKWIVHTVCCAYGSGGSGENKD